ncbi:hypothetical protein CDL12_02103 [Handroanthus impetiginosus]|uniref:RWP-RK domain-containing protein n=1 Tax=Handroanthus impetiginosus TaxID=429701 RepID=A0A2G9I6A0_9LAMI|nr:hypothetical protein CDL12_02103 [Handroanthus impetiginosus]
MANDSSSIFTFHDPFEEIPANDPSLSFFNEDPTLGSFELPFNVEQNPVSYPDHEPGLELNGLFDSEDPLSDSFIWAFCNDSEDDIAGNFQAGHSGFPGEGCSSHGINENCNGSQNPVSGDNSTPSLGFSVPASRYDCTRCQMLREITHTNGMFVKRLEIHGGFGLITHAILGKFDFDSSFPCEEFQLFDFQKESMQLVKNFLVQYFEACKQEGYDSLQDPLSTFYETLSVGLNDLDHQNNDLRSSQGKTGDWNNQQENLKMKQAVGGSNQGGFIKKSLKVQRERTRKMKLKDFKDYFHLPMEVAAQKMNVCLTVMKKVCRKNGVLRWPHRKIKSIERKIAKKRKILDESGDNEEKARALEDIQKHQQELAKIYEKFTK